MAYIGKAQIYCCREVAVVKVMYIEKISFYKFRKVTITQEKESIMGVRGR